MTDYRDLRGRPPDATIVFLQFIRPNPPYDHMGGLHAPGQEGVGLGNGQLRASWRRHAPAQRGPWKGDAV